jgi:hypothetical protein
MAMTDRPSLRTQSFTYGSISLIHVQSLVRDEAHASVLVGKIWPDDIVEDVRFDRIDDVWQGSQPLRILGIFQSGRVDNEAGEVVEVGVREEICRYELANDIRRIHFRVFAG